MIRAGKKEEILKSKLSKETSKNYSYLSMTVLYQIFLKKLIRIP